MRKKEDQFLLDCFNGDIEAVKKAITYKGYIRKINLNVRDSSGENAMVKASSGGHVEIMSLLLQQGVYVNQASYSGTTPLLSATQSCHIDAVRLLLDNGAIVDMVDDFGDTSFMSAARQSNIELMDTLYEKGANINHQDDEGETALMKAATFSRTNVVNYLIEKYANLNIKNNEGFTALMKASNTGNIDIVKALVKSGANMDFQSKNGNTALMLSSFKSEIINFLIDGGADLNKQNLVGNTILMNEINDDHYTMVEKIISKGADVSLVNKDGRTALDLTTAKSDIRYMILLKPELLNDSNRLLINACKVMSEESIMFLYDKEVDFFIENKDGDSAISILKMQNCTPKIEALKEKLLLELDMDDRMGL